jgi:hypothetical protein
MIILLLNTSGSFWSDIKIIVDGNSNVDITNPRVRLRFLMLKINRDNTMNTINAYYEYSINVQPNMTLVKIILRQI